MVEHENIIRLGFFIGMLVLLIIWEQIAPRKQTVARTWLRRINNIALIMFAAVIIRFLLPMLVLVNVALYANAENLGVLNILNLPLWFNIIIAYVLLDLLIYWQHVFMHKMPMLWRLHRVHHSDQDMDVTTGIRFHPIEIILSMMLKAILVIFLGAPVIAVVLFELSLNVLPMFNHANIRLPVKVDKYLRYVLVTPDMHRVHHSNQQIETDSNYCFSVPWWDYLFGTYCAQPAKGHDDMVVGLDNIKKSETIHLHSLLKQPFIK